MRAAKRPHHRHSPLNLVTEASQLLLIFTVSLAVRSLGQSYNGFEYSVNEDGVTITGYAGADAVVEVPPTIPEVGAVTAVGERAFSGRTNLAGVTIPGSVTSIGDSAFSACANLTNVNLAQGLLSIGSDAFSACSNLTGIFMPESVRAVGPYAFDDCVRLEAFTVDPGNAAYSSSGGVLFDKNQSLLIRCPPELGGNYAIPATVIGIPAGAFAQCAKLAFVTIPAGVTYLGENAFQECAGLTLVIIPPGVSGIGETAFEFCTNLTSAYFQGNAPAMGGTSVFDGAAPGFTIYYPGSATGWTTPLWQGYTALPLGYTSAPPLTVKLVWGSAGLTPTFKALYIGQNYQLQNSTDLNTWINSGPPFSATNWEQSCAQSFEVTGHALLFFRAQFLPGVMR